MKELLTIVKVGGAVLENPGKLSIFLKGFTSIEGKKILIHGGGKTATKFADKLGVKSKMIDGRRITDDEILDVVIMTYGGLINKKLVAQLSVLGVKSVGITGADNNSILSSKRPEINGIDYGWVGDIEEVNTLAFEAFFDTNTVPIVAPLTSDGNGNLLNTNADTIASEIARAFAQKFNVSLNFVFDLNGLREDISDETSLIKSIDQIRYQELKENGVISNGMIPKLDNAFATISGGVSHVRLLNVEALFKLSNPNFDDYTIIR
ncbi:acetylglutamate kinase [Ekhidna sp.]